MISKNKEGAKFMENDKKNDYTKKSIKTRFILFGIVFIVLLALGAGLISSYNSETWYFDLGRLAKNHKDDNSKILYKGDNITIYDSLEFDITDPAIRQKKIDAKLKLEGLYLAAIKMGITVSDEELNSKLAEDRRLAESAENYDSDFKAVLSGLSMTADEYWNWDSLRALTRRFMVVEELAKTQKEILAKQYENDTTVDIEVKYKEWAEKEAQDQLDADNVKRIES